MLSSFLEEKLNNASYKILADKTYFGEVKGVRGVWANAKTLEKCRTELKEVLEDWLLLKIKSGDAVPGLRVDFSRQQSPAYA